MYFSKKVNWFGLQGCLYCGSLFRLSDGLCKLCSEDLWSWQNPMNGLFQQKVRKLEVFSVFQWVPGRQEVLSRLIHALKGENGQELWRTYAEEFQKRRIPKEIQGPQKAFLIIPSPGVANENDHAMSFATELSILVGGELYNCLTRAKLANKQKKLSRSQRQQTSFQWSKNFTVDDFSKRALERHIVFVDDVVTTGSTAIAAWIALGKPRDFAIWALAQRGLSCGASKSLV